MIKGTFKVRQPGNGDKVQKSFEEGREDSPSSELKSIPKIDSTRNSGPKVPVK